MSNLLQRLTEISKDIDDESSIQELWKALNVSSEINAKILKILTICYTGKRGGRIELSGVKEIIQEHDDLVESFGRQVNEFVNFLAKHEGKAS